jgi:hypothetical protein
MKAAFLMPLLLLAAACGAQQQREDPTSLAAENPRTTAVLADSAFMVRTLNTRFSRPASPLSVETAPADIARAIRRQYEMRLATSSDDSTALRESLGGQWLLQSMALGDSLRVYVFHFSDLGGEEWMLWLRSKNGRRSDTPFIMEGQLATSPDDSSFGVRLPGEQSLRIADVNGDGRPELLLNARRHNGNVYDAIVAFYLGYDSSLRLHELLRVERWGTIPFDTSARRIERNASFEGGHFVVASTLVNGSNRKPIGSATFSPDGKVIRRKFARGAAFRQFLLSGHPDGEEALFVNPVRR